MLEISVLGARKAVNMVADLFAMRHAVHAIWLTKMTFLSRFGCWPLQSEFAATIVDLADVVAGFATFTDTSKLAEVNDSVLAVGERIEMGIQQAKVFNHRERLFGRDATDYSSLTKIQKVRWTLPPLKCPSIPPAGWGMFIPGACSNADNTQEFDPFATLWRTAYQWSIMRDSIYTAPFASLNGSEIEKQV